MDFKRLSLYVVLLVAVLFVIYYLRKTTVTPTVHVEPKVSSSSQPSIPIVKKDVLKEQANAELNSYYTEAKPIIPEDETTCASVCPFGKPLSTDLPVANMPRCALLSQQSYKLSQFK